MAACDLREDRRMVERRLSEIDAKYIQNMYMLNGEAVPTIVPTRRYSYAVKNER